MGVGARAGGSESSRRRPFRTPGVPARPGGGDGRNAGRVFKNTFVFLKGWPWPGLGAAMDFLADALLLSRVQFALTTAFHILFPPLTIGLAVYLVVLEGLWLKTRDLAYYRQFRFWSGLFAINFAVGVVSGIPLEFQFGTNWGPFSATVGNFFGQVLGF